MMNKITVFVAMLAMSAGAAMAQSTLQLAFQTADGATAVIDASSLSITIAGETLKATNGSDVLEFGLSTLQKMYFTSGVTGVEVATVDLSAAEVDVFTPGGVHVGKFSSAGCAMSSLDKGLYIMKTSENKTFKFVVE